MRGCGRLTGLTHEQLDRAAANLFDATLAALTDQIGRSEIGDEIDASVQKQAYGYASYGPLVRVPVVPPQRCIVVRLATKAPAMAEFVTNLMPFVSHKHIVRPVAEMRLEPAGDTLSVSVEDLFPKVTMAATLEQTSDARLTGAVRTRGGRGATEADEASHRLHPPPRTASTSSDVRLGADRAASHSRVVPRCPALPCPSRSVSVRLGALRKLGSGVYVRHSRKGCPMRFSAVVLVAFACSGAFASVPGTPLDCSDWVFVEPGYTCVRLFGGADRSFFTASRFH